MCGYSSIFPMVTRAQPREIPSIIIIKYSPQHPAHCCIELGTLASHNAPSQAPHGHGHGNGHGHGHGVFILATSSKGKGRLGGSRSVRSMRSMRWPSGSFIFRNRGLGTLAKGIIVCRDADTHCGMPGHDCLPGSILAGKSHGHGHGHGQQQPWATQ